MNIPDVIDLTCDDVIETNGEDGRKGSCSVFELPQSVENDKVRRARHRNSRYPSLTVEEKENRAVEACSSGSSNLCMANQEAPCVIPICRQFWKAGNYSSELKASKQDGSNQLRVHPMFLHSNATSHKWVFGAIAELLDNAFDEVQNGATFVHIDKISNPQDESPALLIQDDGGGMDPEALRRCISFGFSDKKHAIGQYGNGFKTGSMRLGADAIVFTRHMEMRTLTQSVGLLSYTFLRQMGYDRIVVPMARSPASLLENCLPGEQKVGQEVDYEFNSSTKVFGPILEHAKEQFASNLSMLLTWSPYSTEEELLKQFDNIGHHGTKIVIYNLWLNHNGDMELDFDSDSKDIRINGHPKICVEDAQTEQSFDQHIANRYHYSLRAYLSILYLRLPSYFNVILRGHIVEHHNIADDLKFLQFIYYKPKTNNTEAVVVTTIGFVKEAPNVDVHGYCIYHKNRLILPFWHGHKAMSNNRGRGVVGVLEANFIQPTHNKQDFEKTSLFQKLDDRLRDMTQEYWRLHCELLGYQAVKKPKVTLSSQASLQDSLVPERKRSVTCQTRSQQGSNMKYKELNSPETDNGHRGELQPGNRIKNQVEHSERKMILLQENTKLRSRLLKLEKVDKELNMKLQQLQIALQDAQDEYTMLSKSLDML